MFIFHFVFYSSPSRRAAAHAEIASSNPAAPNPLPKPQQVQRLVPPRQRLPLNLQSRRKLNLLLSQPSNPMCRPAQPALRQLDSMEEARVGAEPMPRRKVKIRTTRMSSKAQRGPKARTKSPKRTKSVSTIIEQFFWCVKISIYEQSWIV